MRFQNRAICFLFFFGHVSTWACLFLGVFGFFFLFSLCILPSIILSPESPPSTGLSTHRFSKPLLVFPDPIVRIADFPPFLWLSGRERRPSVARVPLLFSLTTSSASPFLSFIVRQSMLLLCPPSAPLPPAPHGCRPFPVYKK